MITFCADIARALRTRCPQHARMIALASDVPLRRGERAGLWLHLRICKGCRAYKAQVDRLASLVASARAAESVETAMPDAMRTRLRARLSEESPKS